MFYYNLLYNNIYSNALSLAKKGLEFANQYNETQALNKTFAKAIHGQAEPIETYNWVFVFDPTNSYFSFKRVHIVTDETIITSLFHKGRNGGELASRNPFLATLFGTDNLLLCPMDKHSELRSPIEKPFRQREIIKYFDIQAKRAIKTFSSNAPIQLFVDGSLTEDIFGIKECNEEDRLSQITLGMTYMDPEDFVTLIKEFKYEESKVLDLLLKALEKEQLTLVEVQSSIITLYQAGMHTTSRFIRAFSSILLLHPAYRVKITNEWQEFLLKNSLTIETSADFLHAFQLFVNGRSGEMTIQPSIWLHACFREANRLFPLVPTVTRLATKEIKLGEKHIAVGDGVDLDILSANRNARTWENSQQFKPERFIDSEGNLKAENPLINFGMGAQHCIGKHLAKQESFIFVGLQTLLFDQILSVDDLEEKVCIAREHTKIELTITPPKNLDKTISKNQLFLRLTAELNQPAGASDVSNC